MSQLTFSAVRKKISAVKIVLLQTQLIINSKSASKALLIAEVRFFSVERLDAPIERIEIRLMDENATQPVVIDIQKAAPTLPPSSAEASSNSVIEPGTEANKEHHQETKERKAASIGAFEVKMERKVERIVPNPDAIWNAGPPERAQGTAEYVDDLPPLDIGEDAVSHFLYLT